MADQFKVFHGLLSPNHCDPDERDRLWCRALVETLDIEDMNAVLKQFIELREKWRDGDDE